MNTAYNASPAINRFVTQLPPTVSLEQQGEVCCVQPQTIEALQAVLTLLAQPEFATIQVVQTSSDAQTGNATELLWIDTTIATATIYTHKPQDFVVTIGTGKTLEAVESLLQSTNQTLAFTPAYGNQSAMKVGQILAENTLPLEANIRRSSLNELVLGCAGFSPTTAESVAFGGEVVKNVTGYDVQKFLVGHQYALGVVSSVTLRTTPLLPVRGVCTHLFETESTLWACVQQCLAQPSLWMTQLWVKPKPSGWLLTIGVATPNTDLLTTWQATYFPESSFLSEGIGAETLSSKESERPQLVLEIALPLGKTGWQACLHTLIPLLSPDDWQLLPACGVLQVVYHQTTPSISALETLATAVSSLGGAFRVIDADTPLNALKLAIHRLQWAGMPEALQRQQVQLKQQLDPNAQFYSPFYAQESLSPREGSLV